MLPTPGHDEYGDSNMHVCLCMTKLTMLTSDHKAGHKPPCICAVYNHVVRKCKFRPMQSEKCIMQPASTGDQAAPAALQRGVLQPVDAFGMMTAGVTPDSPPCVHTAAWSHWTSPTRPYPQEPKAEFVVNHLTKGGFAWHECVKSLAACRARPPTPLAPEGPLNRLV
jgi:hypothetical protein